MTPNAHGKEEAAERDRLIFATVWVGLGAITHDNKREWLVRLDVLRQLNGCQLLGRNAAGVLERWIGLETNVTDETREKFGKRVLSPFFKRGELKAEAVFETPAA
jgi:hypothetical protein